MKSYCYLIFIALSVLCKTASAQKKPDYSFRLGATFCFGLVHVAYNDAGIGGIAGAERKLDKDFSAEAEVSYNYFIGDKVLYSDGKNKAFAVPLLAGIKAYPLSNIYASLRTGAVYFLLNDMADAKVRIAYGVAAGINFPKKVNRLNLQLAFTSFQYQRITRGYTTLAAAIIIN